MLVGVAAGGKDTHPAPAWPDPGGRWRYRRRAHASFKRVKTVADLDRELAAATAAGRPVMLDFYADWCVSCKEMERYTFADPKVIAEMGRFTLLQADVTANDAQDQALMQGRFKYPRPPGHAVLRPRRDRTAWLPHRRLQARGGICRPPA